MSISEIRLELIKLTYSHGRDATEAVGRAEKLEEYVTREKVSVKKPSPKKKAVTPK